MHINVIIEIIIIIMIMIISVNMIYTISLHFLHNNGYKLNSLSTCFQQGFKAQSVEHRTGIERVMGSNTDGASEFFLGFLYN